MFLYRDFYVNVRWKSGKKNVYRNQALAHCKQLLSPQHPTGNLDPLRRLNTETMPITNPLGLPDAHQLCHREATRPWDGTKISHPKILQSYLPYAPCMVMELWNSYHNSYQVTFDFLQVNILYNRHIMGLVRIMVRIKRNPFSRIVYDIFSISIWMSREIKNHSPSPGLLFSDDGVRFVKSCLENRTFGEVSFFLGSMSMYV